MLRGKDAGSPLPPGPSPLPPSAPPALLLLLLPAPWVSFLRAGRGLSAGVQDRALSSSTCTLLMAASWDSLALARARNLSAAALALAPTWLPSPSSQAENCSAPPLAGLKEEGAAAASAELVRGGPRGEGKREEAAVAVTMAPGSSPPVPTCALKLCASTAAPRAGAVKSSNTSVLGPCRLAGRIVVCRNMAGAALGAAASRGGSKVMPDAPCGTAATGAGAAVGCASVPLPSLRLVGE